MTNTEYFEESNSITIADMTNPSMDIITYDCTYNHNAYMILDITNFKATGTGYNVTGTFYLDDFDLKVVVTDSNTQICSSGTASSNPQTCGIYAIPTRNSMTIRVQFSSNVSSKYDSIYCKFGIQCLGL